MTSTPTDRKVASGTPTHQMVVKVQQPLFTSEQHPAYLIYDEERTFQYMLPMGDMPALDEAMAGHPKRYFPASIVEPVEGRVMIAINPFWPVEDIDW